MVDDMTICSACGAPVAVGAKACGGCRRDVPSGKRASNAAVRLVIVAGITIGGLAVLAVVASIALPALLVAQRASNDRNASASLKTITTAQADFRANDRDGNEVNDFWTADVFALYAMIPLKEAKGAIPEDTALGGQVIKLIEPSVAGADGLSRMDAYGNVTVAGSIETGAPKAGYIYRALGCDREGTLLEDTDGAAGFGAVHNRGRFACIAFPEGRSAGRSIFIVNQDNSVWSLRVPSRFAVAYAPMKDGADSSSSISGTGVLDLGGPGTGAFPADPKAAGCERVD